MAERIDIERPAEAIAWLSRNGLIGEGEAPRMETLPGGVSSRTVLVERERGPSLVLKQSLAKLRVAVDWFSSPERIHREALAIRWFSQLAPAGTITKLFFEDREAHIIAMEAVPKPHVNWKTMLLGGGLRLEHVRQFSGILAALHGNSAARAAELPVDFRDKTFFEALRVEPYYRYISRHAPWFFEPLIEETLATNVALVHGDFSPKNVLLHEGRMVLLDHEVAHFGDPAFDVGFAMAHLLSKAHHLVELRERFCEGAMEFWMGLGAHRAIHDDDKKGELEKRCVRHSLACLLARVWGRSPLEYLSAEERARQASVVLAMMEDCPLEIPAMIERFRKELGCP